jgi:hypothetical protein
MLSRFSNSSSRGIEAGFGQIEQAVGRNPGAQIG